MVEMNYGNFVISLDFELMWGNIESWRIDEYGKSNVSNVRRVIDNLLQLFEKYNVKATFATVGLIMQDGNTNKKDLEPEILPTYYDSRMSPFANGYIYKIKKKSQPLYFGTDIIEKLKLSPFVEIGTQTYSHYYCKEKGQNIHQFEADIKKAVEVAKRKGIELKSIVFPRNQVSENYLEVCKKYGITSYRGNPQKFFNGENSRFKIQKNRICRLIDAYINIGGKTSYKLDSENNGIINIPASRFLRPYSSKLAFAEQLRLRRIRKEMEYAAKHKEVYHLWWHPHNFGSNMKENLKFLESILKTYNKMHIKYGMRSMNMEMFGK